MRWITWWPAPYWIDRFNQLASYEGVKLEVCFLSAGSHVQGWTMDHSSWKFSHYLVNSKYSKAGYFHFQPDFPNPWPLIKPHFQALVMTYGDSSCVTAAAICFMLKKPYFLFVPNTKINLRKQSKIREHLKRLLFQGATGILATGPAQAEYALEYTNRPKKIFVIGNPSQYLGDLVHKSVYQREEWRRDFQLENQFVVLYVGRLSPEKGLSTLFHALEKVYRKGVRPVLVLAGSGPLEATLRRESFRRGLRVVFAGFCQRQELAQYYRASDVFVLPSESEPWGLVVNEAMEFELPLILSDKVGSVPALLHEGVNGLSFPSGNEAALAQCIERLAGDEALRKSMGEASSQMVKGQSIENWCEAVVRAIKETALPMCRPTESNGSSSQNRM